MFGIVRKDGNNNKYIHPLTSDVGAGAPVGALAMMYNKSDPDGYLYCDGSTFDSAQYPALYMYLGTNILPDKDTGRQTGDPYYYIKATSGLAENQQENVLNQINTNNSYSETEQPTGAKWIDGKPIYRRVITGLNYGSATVNQWTSTGATVTGIDKLIKAQGLRTSDYTIPDFIFRKGTNGIEYLCRVQLASVDAIIAEYTKSS